MKGRQTKQDLLREIQGLTARLQEAEEVIQAIQKGEVDGLLVTTPEGERVFTLEGAELPYRIFVESMHEGAATLTHEGVILYANPAFARMLRLPQEKVVHKVMRQFIHPDDREIFTAIFKKGAQKISEGEVLLRNNIPVQISLQPLPLYDASPVICAVITDLSRQKKLKATIASLNRTSAIFNQAADAIIVCDQQGIITQASREALRYGGTLLLGMHFDEAVDMAFSSFSPLQKKLFTIADVLQGGIVRKQEVLLSAGENKFYCLFSAQPLRGKNREIIGCVLTLTDITAQKQAEEKIQSQAMEIENLYHNAAVGLCMVDENLRFVRINERLAGINGIPAVEHIGRSIRELMPELADAVESSMRRILETGEPMLNMEIVSQTPAQPGVKRSFLEHWMPVKDGRGEILGLNIVVEETTERKRVEQALRESEERLQLAWKATRDVIWDWDVVNNVQRWSGAGSEVFGWTDPVDSPQTEEWWLERVHPDDRRRVAEGFQRVLDDALCSQWQDQYRFLCKDGAVANVLDRGFVLRDGEGKPTRMIGAMLDITDIMKIKQELERTRNILAEAQKIAHMGSFEYIVATRTTVWSEEEYRIYGLDPTGPSPTYEVLLARSIHPDDAAHLHDTFTTAMQNRSVYELQHRIVRPDGSVRWVYDRAYPYFDADGSLLRYVGATLDVTDRKQAEDALRQSRRDLDRAQAVGHIGWWRLDVLSNVLNWSDENYRIFGVPPGAPLTYETFLGMVHPDDRHYVGTRWKAALAGEPYDIEHRILADGRLKWVREKAYLEYDETGKLMSGFGITQDITERKKIEEALTQSTSLLQAVLDNTPDAIFLKDRDGRLQICNPATLGIIGKPAETVIGKTDRELYDDSATAQAIMENDRRIMRSGKMEVVEECVRDAHGTRVYLSTKAPYRDSNGRIIGLIGVARDITERKQMEDNLHLRTVELEQLSTTLEQRVQERTEELRMLNLELLQSQNRLKQLSRDLLDAQEKERKKVAWELHDSIGSSLTAIKFRIENVLRESVSNGSQAMDHLQKLVPVVQTAVMEAKRIQMNLRPSILDDIGIVATTRWFCTQFRETYPEVQLARHVKIEEDDVPDSLKTVIFRIFQEGLNNAARHSKSPQVSFYMWKSNKTLRLLIRDRGEGFDLSEVQSRTGYVRGLGLESMRERAELSGGRFIIASRQGKGTTIRVSWPLTGNS